MSNGGRRIVTLTTDFGTAGYHVGAMKGALLSVHPDLTIVDLCHGIPPGDVAAGAWALLWNWRHFPAATVHLAVVDPGVGTDRRALAVAAGGHFFVGPDNGLLFPAASDAGDAVWHALGAPAESVSATFHGRDVFAPAAARICAGAAPDNLGSAADDPVSLLLPRPSVSPGERVSGEIVSVDHFGNLVSNITAADLSAGELGTTVMVGVAGMSIRGLKRCYGEGAAGEAVAVINSSGHLEVAVAGRRADTLLGAAVGDAVELRRPGEA